MRLPSVFLFFEQWKDLLHLRTYHIELGFALVCLSLIAILSGKGWVEWIGVAAVYFTFAHTTVADRLAEAQAKEIKEKNKATVECFHKLEKYFYAKEICWCVYFFILGAWSALAGVFLFMVYPFWRKWWRRHKPL